MGIRGLDPGQRARGGVDLVRRDRVLLRAERLVRAVRRVHEVARHVHLGGLGARGERRAARVRGRRLLAREREALGVRVGCAPRRHRVPELVHRVQH